jgi:hypothetical protein
MKRSESQGVEITSTKKVLSFGWYGPDCGVVPIPKTQGGGFTPPSPLAGMCFGGRLDAKWDPRNSCRLAMAALDVQGRTQSPGGSAETAHRGDKGVTGYLWFWFWGRRLLISTTAVSLAVSGLSEGRPSATTRVERERAAGSCGLPGVGG